MLEQEADLSLEVVILLILGIFMLLLGLLLFAIQTGHLLSAIGTGHLPNSTYGLFLVIVSFQTITMGKTPFGDLRRSWALVIAGIFTAILGMFACFIPGYFTDFARILVGIILLSGGISLLLQLFISQRKARIWLKVGGALYPLTIACGLVYALTIFLGILTILPGVTTTLQTAILVIFYGMSYFYLSWCLLKAAKWYPAEMGTPCHDNGKSKEGWRLFRQASLPLSSAILILLGVLLTFLGLLLFPVNLGVLPFSPDGQLGLLLTVMAIQMLALGDTPLGTFKRSSLMIITGLVFATLGVVSSIVPGMLTGIIMTLLGGLNLIGGATSLTKRYLTGLQEITVHSTEIVIVPPNVKKLISTQTALSGVQIGFGISMLIPGIIPSVLMAGILVVNGLLLFKLVALQVTGMQPYKEQPSINMGA